MWRRELQRSPLIDRRSSRYAFMDVVAAVRVRRALTSYPRPAAVRCAAIGGVLAWIASACHDPDSPRDAAKYQRPGDTRAARTATAAGRAATEADAGVTPAGSVDDDVPDSGSEAAPVPPERMDASAGAAEPADEPPTTNTPAPPSSSDAGTSVVEACRPSAAGPYDVLEGDSLRFTIACASGLAWPAGFSIEPMPSGAALGAGLATFTWTPAYDQAAHYTLTLRANGASVSDTGSVDIFVIDRADAAQNLPLRDPSQYTEEYGLPVIHLTTDPGLNDDEYTPATITYRGHTYSGAEAKFRGATSAAYPKRSFTLKFTKQDKFSEPALAGGFNEKRKITVITSFDDNSYLRQRLGYELWNRLDPAHIRVQSYNAVLFWNGRYFGLYTVADHIDGYLMEDFGLYQDGNLYKARTHDANFRTTQREQMGPDGALLPKATLHDGFTKEEGLPAEGEPGAFDDLEAFVSWVATASAGDFAAQIDATLARKEYEDWWIFVSFIRAEDSAGKNSYHYHDPSLPGSLWRVVPWDLNESFGQNWKTERRPAQADPPEGYYLEANHLFERLLADERMGPALRARYASELGGPVAQEAVLALFDAMVREIDASARRDEAIWQSAYRGYFAWAYRGDFTSYDQEVQYVRQWISERHAYLRALYGTGGREP